MDKLPDLNDSFRAEEHEIEHFVKSDLWHDFALVLVRRKAAFQADFATVQTLEDLKALQGELRGIEFWLKLPGEILAEKKRIDEAEAKLKEIGK